MFSVGVAVQQIPRARQLSNDARFESSCNTLIRDCRNHTRDPRAIAGMSVSTTKSETGKERDNETKRDKSTLAA